MMKSRSIGWHGNGNLVIWLAYIDLRRSCTDRSCSIDVTTLCARPVITSRCSDRPVKISVHSRCVRGFIECHTVARAQTVENGDVDIEAHAMHRAIGEPCDN